jgi:diguanylate cyclase (GGDEF)-like protein
MRRPAVSPRRRPSFPPQVIEALAALAAASSEVEAHACVERIRAAIDAAAPELAPVLDAMLARALELEALKHAAETDPMTGVKNRRGFGQALAREEARAEREGRPLCLIMMDMDGLKSINDRFGHDAGDEAIKNMAAATVREVRAIDTVARLGGDEFAVLLPGVDEAEGHRIAERVKAAVEREEVCGVTLRVSMGVACGPRRMRLADEKLYDSKLLRVKTAR